MTRLALAIAVLASACDDVSRRGTDPLPSWNDSAPKQALISFVERVTRAGGPDFVPAAERIAVFDNDGTLWAERPMYVQAFFALDPIKSLAPQHPEWKTKEPFASVLKGDVNAALAGGERALVEPAMTSHAGTTTDEFATIVRDRLGRRHRVRPRVQRADLRHPAGAGHRQQYQDATRVARGCARVGSSAADQLH